MLGFLGGAGLCVPVGVRARPAGGVRLTAWGVRPGATPWPRSGGAASAAPARFAMMPVERGKRPASSVA